MSREYPRSFIGFVDMLEKRARTARAISISITIVTIALATGVLLFSIQAIRKQINEEQVKLELVKQKRIEAETQLASLNEEYQLTVQRNNLSRTALNELPPEKREELLQKAEVINRTNPDTPKVYLQILDNNQRDQANGISGMLKRNGFKVQGVEWVRVPVVAPKQTQVKYFRSDYADEAQKIVTLLKQSGIQAMSVSLSAATGQIEVWFSTDAFPAKKENGAPGPQSGESAGLSKAADDTLFEFMEALGRPADKDATTKKLQSIVAALERDKSAIRYLKAQGISSHDTSGLRIGLLEIRRAVKNDRKFELLNKINQVIVDLGK